MRRSYIPILLSLLAVAVAVSPIAQGTTVLKMDLGELCDNSHSIFRGTVLSASSGTVEAGGAELPTITYRLRVDEGFKGTFSVVDGQKVAEITMLGSLSNKPRQVGGAQLISALPELPNLAPGQEYLLMTSTPSSIGLSTTVGLGQGCFSIKTHDGLEMAVNEIGNAGLFEGPVSYEELAVQIRSALQQ